MATPQQRQVIAVNLTDVTRHNVGQIKLLNKSVLPVPYSDTYYQETVSNWPRENPWCRLAYHNEYLVGAVNGRIETYNPDQPLKKVAHLTPGKELVPVKDRKTKLVDGDGKQLRYRLYISTLSVLEAYRGGNVGTTLIKDVLATADAMKSDLDHVYVHVHVDNLQAQEFYKKFGFASIGNIEGYYRNDLVTPPDAVVLVRPIGYKETKNDKPEESNQEEKAE